MISMVMKRMGKYAVANPVMRLRFCEMAQIRIPLLRMMNPMLQLTVLVETADANDFVLRARERSVLRKTDQEILAVLVKSSDLTEVVRAGIVDVSESFASETNSGMESEKESEKGSIW
jgi:hypothetical protein